ncbi:Dual specificity phosphatase, catalytic domain [Halopseudomonas sabulinigri]|uniref:Dual specificity phosphatase, catalytic domain n=1 Tax=Halopseudomonas sabulinigri TaxID=472181 RepID=A0A1H1T375_9GAMM|nr:dual specificity protein phosphatase family protein [Halopseudomonas sabulinigri]SDS54618.1 Dual specificity phosphatase, catalytic domain [Halopseudomonas sabulinigri]
MNRVKRVMRPAAWLALPLALLAIVALWRPDVLRSDEVAFPPRFLAAQTPRPTGWAQPLDEEFRFYTLSPTLYRSALPQADDVAELRARGITTVINFYQQDDAAWLTDGSIARVHIPLRGDRVTDTEVISVLRAIRAGEQRGGVLVHCKHGQNRTGLVTAMYRIVYDGWSREEAMAEMLEGGFGRAERMDDAVGYLNRVDLADFKQAIFGGECSTNPLAWCRISRLFAREGTQRQLLPTDVSLR